MKLRTGTAFVLMICLIVFSVGFGAYRGWSRERAEVEKAYNDLNGLVLSSNSRLEAMLSRRIEAADSLLTVAQRHLSGEDEAVQALSADRDALAGRTSLAQKMEANLRLTQHAETLLHTLGQMESVRQNARDLAYVAQPGYLRTLLNTSESQAGGQPFSQAVDSFREAVGEYNQAADDFNGELGGSFSGWVARLLGVKAAEKIDDPTDIAFAVAGQPRYPQRPEGAVADQTRMSVLDEQTIADLNTLSDRLYQAAGSRLYVAAVDFLDRVSLDDYAAELVRQWALQPKDALLVMAVGEGSRVLTGGSAALATLDPITQERLLSRYFDSSYQSLEYSRAAAGLARAVAQELAKPASLNTAGLFGTFAAAGLNEKEPAATEAPPQEAGNGHSLLNSALDTVHQLSATKASAHRFNWRGVLIWGLVIYFIFFRKKKAYKKR